MRASQDLISNAVSSPFLSSTKVVLLCIALASIGLAQEVPEPVRNAGPITQSFKIPAFCLVLTLGYIFHGWLVWKQNRSLLENAVNRNRRQYSTFRSEPFLESEWPLALGSIALPVGLAVIAETMASNDLVGVNLNIALFLYHSVRTVLIVLITLEFSLLLHLRMNRWRIMLIATLVLDLLSFFLFSRIPEPNKSSIYSAFTLFFMGTVGVGSLVSSYMTIVFSRSFEAFVLDVSDSDISVNYSTDVGDEG